MGRILITGGAGLVGQNSMPRFQEGGVADILRVDDDAAISKEYRPEIDVDDGRQDALAGADAPLARPAALRRSVSPRSCRPCEGRVAGLPVADTGFACPEDRRIAARVRRAGAMAPWIRHDSAAATRQSDRRQLASFVVTGGTRGPGQPIEPVAAELRRRLRTGRHPRLSDWPELGFHPGPALRLHIHGSLARRICAVRSGQRLQLPDRARGQQQPRAPRSSPVLGFTWHVEDVAHVIGVASPILISY